MIFDFYLNWIIDVWLLIRSVISLGWRQRLMATWAVLSRTRGPGKLMSLKEGHLEGDRWSEGMRDHRLDKRHKADRSSCHTQLSWEREGIPGESVACEPCVAEYQRSERLCALQYHAWEWSKGASSRSVISALLAHNVHGAKQGWSFTR